MRIRKPSQRQQLLFLLERELHHAEEITRLCASRAVRESLTNALRESMKLLGQLSDLDRDGAVPPVGEGDDCIVIGLEEHQTGRKNG